MLRKAQQQHEQKQTQSRLTQSLFNSSQTAQQPKSTSQPANPGYKNPLKPASASTVNAAAQWQPPHRGPVKRTSSGLAKVLDGSFESDFGSQEQPVIIDGPSPARKNKSHVPQPQLFDEIDENDFDSDIDLDIEEPRPQKEINYPKLPSQLVNQSEEQSFTYPKLPRPIASGSGVSGGTRPKQGHTDPRTASQQAPDSSAPLPWSSSPSEHYSSKIPPNSFQQFAFGGQALGAAVSNDLAQPKPPKRRTLPWHNEEESTTVESVASSVSAAPKSRLQSTSTPSKDVAADRSFHPWNTTLSAYKEKAKKHREEAKKVVKGSDGTDESVRKAKSTQKRPARVFLSDEQQHVLDLVIEKKKSVFFTGSAGTGKSVLMREIIASLRRKHAKEPDRVAVTASTGLAACNVGGVTLHSFAGIGLGKEEVPELVKKIKRNQKAKHRWMRTKVLVVDEVSMVDGDLFDKLEAIARIIRSNARPFGGIQLVITGDFFQLPPVPENNRAAKFAFDAATWPTSIEHTIGLHHVFRQKDPVFAGMLNEMREGRLSQSSINAFQNLQRPLTFEDMLSATELFPTRQEVDRANTERLAHLQGQFECFQARDGGSITDKAFRDKLLQNCMAPEEIKLKKGAQVMLIKNIDESLVNGSLGRVIGFMDERQFDSYNNSDNAYLQSPGGTIQNVNGQGGTSEATARARLMEGVTTSRKWPLVRFAIADGTWRDLLCEPEVWKVELPSGEVQASRSQIPLILAWALSIHKAQGQTLDRVKVDLGKVFEKGQAYVALSRATSMAGLQVLRFDPKKVNAHERVRAFYSKLARVELAEKNQNLAGKASKPGTSAADYEQRFVEGNGDSDWE